MHVGTCQVLRLARECPQVQRGVFDLHVIRSTEEGTTYEDSVAPSFGERTRGHGTRLRARGLSGPRSPRVAAVRRDRLAQSARLRPDRGARRILRRVRRVPRCRASPRRRRRTRRRVPACNEHLKRKHRCPLGIDCFAWPSRVSHKRLDFPAPFCLEDGGILRTKETVTAPYAWTVCSS